MLHPKNKQAPVDVPTYRIEWVDNRIDFYTEATPENIVAPTWAALEEAICAMVRSKRNGWREGQSVTVNMVRDPETGVCEGYVTSGVQSIGHFTLRKVPS